MIDVNKMTAKEKAALLKQLEADKVKQEAVKENEIEVYKQTKNILVSDTIKSLENLSSLISKAKADVFDNFSTLLIMKKELYGYKDGQKSHTFSNEFGQSIEIGFREIDDWDDTVDAGVAKINQYLKTLSTDTNTAKLVSIIQDLLKKDSKGNLQAKKMIQLKNKEKEINDPVFSDGINIIIAAHRPARSAWFVEGTTKGKTNNKIGVPLSISACEFPEGREIDLSAF